MSRTYKHIKKVKLKKYYRERWETEHIKYNYEAHKYLWPDFDTPIGLTIRTAYLKKPGVLTKKRKEVDTENHWMSTPSWWVRMTMNKPQRRSVSLWEQQLSNLDTSRYNPSYEGTYPYEDLDLFDKPYKKVGHVYFW